MAEKKDYSQKYSIIKELGTGGNAIVYKCKKLSDETEVALKVLIYRNVEKKGRFKNEIDIVIENASLIGGIIPILDFYKPSLWYTMPLATSVIEHITKENENIIQIVNGIIQLTETLFFLHQKEVSHRDIKPSNIYSYNGRYCLADFGLVDFPDYDNNFTRSDKGLGAIFTIAPEMKRNPKDADGKKADVFSLAKTLWMLLTLDEKGFDGTYNFLDVSYSLRFNSKYKNIHLVELEELLHQATLSNPDDRPTIDNFKLQLENWIRVYSDQKLSQLSGWKFLNKYLFTNSTPDSSSWSNIDSIVAILNIVGSIPSYNYMFFSDCGGLDFDRADKAAEKDCIYVYAHGFCYVVKPKKLYFEGFDNYEWNYFLLELDELQPVFGDRCINSSAEELVEDYPSHYVSAENFQYGVYDYDLGNVLPEGSKLVERYLKGKLLIVLKLGPYNSINAADDGRHGDCTNAEFRNYLETIISLIKKGEDEGHSQEIILTSHHFNQNPFKADESFAEKFSAL